MLNYIMKYKVSVPTTHNNIISKRNRTETNMNLSKLVLVRAMQTNSQGQTRLPNIPANTKCILVYQYTESKFINS